MHAAPGAPKVDDVTPAGDADTSQSKPAASTDEASQGSFPDEASPPEPPDPGLMQVTREFVAHLMKTFEIGELAACRMITNTVIPKACTSLNEIFALRPNAMKLVFDRVMDMRVDEQYQ